MDRPWTIRGEKSRLYQGFLAWKPSCPYVFLSTRENSLCNRVEMAKKKMRDAAAEDGRCVPRLCITAAFGIPYPQIIETARDSVISNK